MMIRVVCVLFAVAIITSLFVDFRSRPVHARTADFHVVIDAGHGGHDGGAVGKNGTREADVVLAIARFLESELKSIGIGTTMTRTTEADLAAPMARNRKRSDMDARRRIIESVQPDLVVSIHLNSLPSHPGVRGFQAFFNQSGEISRHFAESLQAHFNNLPLQGNRRASTGDFYILNSTGFPSVLLECGFLSNPNDEALLRTTEYQQFLAANIAEAIDQARRNVPPVR